MDTIGQPQEAGDRRRLSKELLPLETEGEGSWDTSWFPSIGQGLCLPQQPLKSRRRSQGHR